MRVRAYWPASFVVAGFLFAGAGIRKHKRVKAKLWLTLAGLGVVLVLLNACGGGGSSVTTNPTTYNVKIQGTTGQPSPVTITTATLIVQ
jgi:hypothetical protein